MFAKLIKSLFNIILLTVVLTTVFFWLSPPDKREELLIKINYISPVDIFNTKRKFHTTLRENIKNFDLEKKLPITVTSSIDESLNNHTAHFNPINIDCGTVQPQQLIEKSDNQQKVYQWKDEQGRMHFSDTKQDISAQDISTNYQGKNNYITTKIENRNSSFPLSLNDIIELSIEKMFNVLSDALSIKQLHQLSLHLKIFGDRPEFQSYLKQKAPSLSHFAAGFYLPKLNEASVLVQSNQQLTLGLIRHESSHVIMANLYGQSPIWLNEGFAEYFRHLKISGQEATIYPNNKHLNLLRKSAKNKSLSVENHLNLNHKEWVSNEVTLHYAEAWSIVYFLLSEKNHKRLLKDYMALLSKNRCLIPNSSAYFKKHFPGGLNAMNQQWLKWIHQSEIHPHRY